MQKKWLFLIIALAWVAQAWASGYVVVMVSGESYRCVTKYVVDTNGMVRFKLNSGPEIAVPKDKIAWYETAIANGELPPGGSKPIKKHKTGDVHKPKKTFDMIPLSFPDTGSLGSDLKTLIQDGISLDVMTGFGFLTWMVLLLVMVVTHFLASFLLWYIMNLFGEPHFFLKVLGANALLFLLAAVIIFLIAGSPLDPISTLLLAVFLNLFISAVLLVWIFECESSAAVMALMLYQVVVGLFGFGIWKVLSLWIG